MLNVYAEDGVLGEYDPATGGTGVDIKDKEFVENLMYGNITFNNCSHSIGYGIEITRKNSSGWSYDSFMNKAR